MAQPSLDHENEDAAKRSTIRFYNVEATRYAKQTLTVDLSHIYDRFLNLLPVGASVLDVGCGAGRDLEVFRRRGFRAVGLEPAESLAAIAREVSGCEVIIGNIEELTRPGEFDGIWACASLLHLSRRRLPLALDRINAALKGEGILFLSVQRGVGEFTSPDGRFYALYQPDEIALAANAAGFDVIEQWETGDSLAERPIRWINVLARSMRDHL
jgi:SAM-dependent methyltransferase